MRISSNFAWVVGSVAFAWAARGAACGGGGVTSQNAVVANAQRIVMSLRADGTTDIVAQIGVPQTSADYGVLIPVPSEPTLDPEPVPSEELASLDNLTKPRVFVQTPSSNPDGGCGCGSVKGDDDSASGGTPSGVSVISSVNIGPVVAVSLTGDDASAISQWLTENGFNVPAADSTLLDSYVGPGNFFIAIRRKETTAKGSASSIGVHYTLQGDHRKMSLGFARLGAAPTVAFTLFLVASRQVGPSAPFAALTLNDLDRDALLRRDYAGAVQAAVSAHDHKAFVLEQGTRKDQVAYALPKLSKLFDDYSVITRATTVVPRAALTEDAIFATDYEPTIPNERFADNGLPRARYASLGPFGLLLLAGALRRRSRPRA